MSVEKNGDWIAIVSGLPRSGTSMMMRLIEAGGIPALVDNVRQADEDNPRGYYEFERVKQVKEDTAWLPEARGKVVKMVYRLLYDLPAEYRYRVVFMLRPLAEVIASQEKMLARQGKPTGDIPPERLEALYQKQLDEVREWLKRQSNFEVLYVQYQDALDHPDAVAQRLNSFFGGNLEVEEMLAVPDRSLYRNRR